LEHIGSGGIANRLAAQRLAGAIHRGNRDGSPGVNCRIIRLFLRFGASGLSR
jgi:hypothetical protein